MDRCLASQIPRSNTIGLLSLGLYVYETEIASGEELVSKINTTAIDIRQRGLGNVQREMRRSAEACVRARGGHFVQLL